MDNRIGGAVALSEGIVVVVIGVASMWLDRDGVMDGG